MNVESAMFTLAALVIGITDPKTERWKREQLEAIARPLAKKYVKTQ